MEDNVEFKRLDTMEQKSSIKLIKNTKGYNWEIKIYIEGNEKLDFRLGIEKLEFIDEQLKEKYGGENGN